MFRIINTGFGSLHSVVLDVQFCTTFCVPWWPCEQGVWLVTWRSRVRGRVAAACRLLAGQPWASLMNDEVHMLRPTQPATNWTANEYRAVITVQEGGNK